MKIHHREHMPQSRRLVATLSIFKEFITKTNLSRQIQNTSCLFQLSWYKWGWTIRFLSCLYRPLSFAESIFNCCFEYQFSSAINIIWKHLWTVLYFLSIKLGASITKYKKLSSFMFSLQRTQKSRPPVYKNCLFVTLVSLN